MKILNEIAYLYNWPCIWQTDTILEEDITRSIPTHFCIMLFNDSGEKGSNIKKKVVKESDNKRQVMTKAHFCLLLW